MNEDDKKDLQHASQAGALGRDRMEWKVLDEPEPRYVQHEYSEQCFGTENGELAILLVSCDAYKDLWPLCAQAFERFWPDCNYKRYLLCNERAFLPGFRALAVGPDKGWSANLLKALESVPEEFVLLYLEDLILDQPVDTAKVDALFHWFREAHGNCLRMNPKPPADLPCNDMVGIAAPLGLYRTSTVMALWRRSVLIELLDPAESAWDFEISGSRRSDRYDGFYVAHAPTLSVINTVGRGKWSRRAIRRVRRLGVEPDLSARPTLSVAEEWKGRLMEFRSALLRLVPWQYRHRVRQTLLG